MPDKALIRFIAEGVLLKKLGPGILQYSLKLLSNSFPGFFPTLTSFRSSKEKGRGWEGGGGAGVGVLSLLSECKNGCFTF